MTHGWDILRGNPAPGSPSDLDQTIRAFTKVATQADDARSLLAKTSSAIDPAVWQGSAADAFRDGLEQLPDQLARVQLSYADAADALRGYCSTLTTAQERARALRQAAADAASDVSRAESSAAAAQERMDTASRRKRDAEARRDGLRRQQSAATEPTTHANLGGQIAGADSSVRNARGDYDNAHSERERQNRAAEAARGRLSRTIAQAKDLFEEVQRAAEIAARLIEAAESDANLPNWMERAVTDTKEFLVTYGPVIVDALQTAATLFSIAAAVFPIGAPVFLTVSLVCGGASLLLNVGVTAASPEGFTTAKVLELGLQALSIAGAACGLGMINGVKWAATAAKVVDAASKTGQLAKGTVEGGVDGLLRTAGVLVLGKGAEKFGGALLNKAATKLSSSANPIVRATIAGFTREVRQVGKDGIFKVIPVPAGAVQRQQCLLTGSNIGPGGFQLGNTARNAPSAMDHNPTATIIAKTFEDAVGEPAEYVLEKGKEAVEKSLKAGRPPEPELYLPQE